MPSFTHLTFLHRAAALHISQRRFPALNKAMHDKAYSPV
jgi:hypothetical protein